MRRYAVTHFYHSGFSVSCGDTILVFDYWRGENGELAENLQLTPEILGAYSHIIVFISHDHPDHMDPVVFTWKDVPGLQYVIASDMPAGTPGLRLAPGDSEELPGDVKVTAFDSTDLGVSFLVDFRGLSVFHAGDLNFWHWREESTMKEIEEADREFRKAVAPICGKAVDLAFFPVDPRQGPLFESGANYFILAVKPRILIPMHYFNRPESAVEYARTATCRTTEVIAMPGNGDVLLMDEDEQGYLNLSIPELPEEPSEPEPAVPADPLLPENDPFLESDLPLIQLAENPPAPPPAPEAEKEAPGPSEP